MILLFEADESFRAGVAGDLRQRGHRVAEVSAVAELCSSPRHAGVSAILLGSDGDRSLALADELHDLYPAAAVVIATAQRELAARPEVHQRDFLYCFCKPLSAAALSGMIEILLPTRPRAAARAA